MQVLISQFIANIWLPLAIWTVLAIGFRIYQQLVNKLKITSVNAHLWINVIIWMLPISVFFQFISIKLLANFTYLDSIPRLLDFSVDINALIVGTNQNIAPTYLNFILLIAVVWVIGCVFGFVKLFYSWVSIQTQLKNMAVLNREELNIISSAKVFTQHFQRLVRETTIRISDQSVSPCVVNALKPTIILPKGILQDKALLEIALLHELIHIKNNDLLYSLINHCIKIVFWFHPIIHLYTKLASKKRELFCDLEVMRFGSIKKADYANSLVLVSNQYKPFSLLCMSAKASQLKIRIQDISLMNLNDVVFNSRRLKFALGITCLSLLTTILLLNPKMSVVATTSNTQPLATSELQEPALPEIVGGFSVIFSKLKYPDEARNYGIEGRVVIGFFVDEFGKAQDIQIIRGIGYGCDEEAINAVKSTVFKSTQLNGMNALTRYSIPIVFKLQNSQ